MADDNPGLQPQPIVHVADMAAAIAFYQHLGAEVIHGGRDTDWTLMQLGTLQISLLVHRPDAGHRESPVELNFVAAMPLDRLEQRLRRAGVPVAEAMDHLHVTSPDGLLIKIGQLAPEAGD
jgi:hypothetical protein